MEGDETRKRITAEVRGRFTEVREHFEDRNVRHPDVGALLEVIIDHAVRIERLEGMLSASGLSPALSTTEG